MNRYPTLPELMNMSKQDIFDHIARHLLRQARKCWRPGEDGSHLCLYRGDDGTACAVGAIIPDSCYATAMEHHDVVTLAQWCDYTGHAEYRLLARVLFRHMTLLARLQRMHDKFPPSAWPRELHCIAQETGLSGDAIDGMPGSRRLPVRYLDDDAAFRQFVDRLLVTSSVARPMLLAPAALAFATS